MSGQTARARTSDFGHQGSHLRNDNILILTPWVLTSGCSLCGVVVVVDEELLLLLLVVIDVLEDELRPGMAAAPATRHRSHRQR